MADIFREVEEDLRHDKLREVWDKYGTSFIGSVGGAIVIIAAFIFYQNYQENKRLQDSDAFDAAVKQMQDGQIAEAAASFDALAGKATGGYRILARFQQAAALSASGDVAGAVDIYDQLSAGGSANELFADLAQIKAAWLLVETASADDIQTRMAPLATDTNTWRHTAKELIAYAAYRSGDLDTARTSYLELFIDQSAPQTTRARAQQLLQLIGAPEPPAITDETEIAGETEITPDTQEQPGVNEPAVTSNEDAAETE